ncbi:MAG: hypothetical protein QG635_651 [Bacteroidota bacterium]|nr:hypothetical protein [Bacteroidota bacterium]
MQILNAIDKYFNFPSERRFRRGYMKNIQVHLFSKTAAINSPLERGLRGVSNKKIIPPVFSKDERYHSPLERGLRGVFLSFIILLIASIPSLNAQTFQEERNNLPIKCGTFIHNHLTEKLKEKLLADTSLYFSTQCYYDCPSGKFRIHYDTTGTDAVESIDLNHNNIPDWIDTNCTCFERAWSVEIDSLGYAQPPSDSGAGGNEAYDIVIQELGNRSGGLYGFTAPLNEILPRKKFYRSSSLIMLDNNYSAKDTTTNQNGARVPAYPRTNGSDALKVTAAHEFHHAIQYGYGDAEPFTGELSEMASVYMETVVYPEIKDYYQYLPILFKNLEQYNLGDGGNSLNGYSWVIFYIYACKVYGDSLLLRTWELIGDGIDSFTALDSSFREKGTTLPLAFCDFMPWMYYTGSRTIENTFFKNAAEYPMLYFDAQHYPSRLFSAPYLQDDGLMKSFEIRPFEYVLPDKNGNAGKIAFDMLIAQTDIDAAKALLQDKFKPFVVKVALQQDNDAVPIKETNCFFSIKAPEGNICNFIAPPDASTIPMPYPNPFIPGKDKEIYFPVPGSANLQSQVLLIIYNASMDEVFNDRLNIVKIGNLKYLRTGSPDDIRLEGKLFALLESENIPAEMSSGVYIFVVKFNDDQIIGKFAVQRK